MPLNRRVFEPRPTDNGPRQRSAIGIAAVVLAALALWAWMGHTQPNPSPTVPASPTFVRLHK